ESVRPVGSHGILPYRRRRADPHQGQTGRAVAHAPVLDELSGVDYAHRRGCDGARFIQSNLLCAGRHVLAEEKVIQHLAVDVGELGFAGDLTFAPGYSLRKLLLAIELLYISGNIERDVLQRAKLRGSGAGSGVAADWKTPQGA